MYSKCEKGIMTNNDYFALCSLSISRNFLEVLNKNNIARNVAYEFLGYYAAYQPDLSLKSLI